MRNSWSLVIIPKLVDKGATVRAHDQQGMEEAKKLLSGKVQYFEGVYEMIKGADTCVLMTEWNEYRRLDFMRTRKLHER